jgi:SAM-dependent methyltransferase
VTDTRADYTARYIDQYAAGGFETILVAVRREQVLDFLRRYGARRVLEIGCGLEPLFPFWNDFTEMTIVEPSPELAARAGERAAGDPRIDIRQAFLEEIASGLAEKRPDAIVVSSLLHEVPDPSGLLAAVRELCSRETKVHFNVPNVRSFHRLLALEMGLIGDLFEQSETEKRFHRHTRFDRARFEDMLRGAGFEVLESGTYFIKPFTHAQLDVLLASGAADARIVEGLKGMTRYLPEMGCELFANVRLRP